VRARRLALTAQLNDLRSKLAATEEQTSKFTSLQHKVNELEANYQIYTQKRDESLMRDAMDQHQLLNVAVAEEPTYSITPARPQPLTDGVLTILTAIFMACFAVYVVDNGRSTFANARELEAVTRHPVLATVPTISFMEGPLFEEKSEFRPSTPSSNRFDGASGRQ
jgi:capsular polysaccharide biosynthesis protein